MEDFKRKAKQVDLINFFQQSSRASRKVIELQRSEEAQEMV